MCVRAFIVKNYSFVNGYQLSVSVVVKSSLMPVVVLSVSHPTVEIGSIINVGPW
jgi:hypothetical protein